MSNRKCGNCGIILTTTAIQGVCCSEHCADQFLKPIPEKEIDLPNYTEMFRQFCLLYGVEIQINEKGQILF